jgi:hypothetical protein
MSNTLKGDKYLFFLIKNSKSVIATKFWFKQNKLFLYKIEEKILVIRWKNLTMTNA